MSPGVDDRSPRRFRVVRGFTGIPADQIIVITVAMGWHADDFPADDVGSERRPTDEIVTYVGFDD